MKFLKQLDKRLILLISLMVIPVNCLAIIFSSISIREAQKRLRTSFEKDFEIYMERNSASYERIEEWYRNYILKYQNSLMDPNYYSAVQSINMTNEISNVWNLYGALGFFYIRENVGEGNLFFKISKNLYEEKHKEALRQELEIFLEEKKDKRESGWVLENIGNTPFCMIQYHYQNYDIGIAFDLEKQLEEWFSTENAEYGTVVITSEEKEAVLEKNSFCNWREKNQEKIQQKTDGQSKAGHYLVKDKRNILISLTDVKIEGIVPKTYRILQFVAYLSLAMIWVLWIVIRKQAVEPLKALEKGMKELDQGDWYYRIEKEGKTEEFAYMYRSFNQMADSILLARTKEAELYQVKLNNLKLQVNPHVLLNSLTTIYSMAQTKKYEGIQKFVMNLVEYFRYCLRENNEMVPLSSEIRFIENYMEIQKVRYPGELSFSYQVEESCEEAEIPAFLIQNFVENAVKYGRIADATIEVLVNVRRDAGKLLISVCDTGKGIAPEIMECLNKGEIYQDNNGQKHIGVWNCRKRLEYFYDGCASLKMTSTVKQGTQVWIELPCDSKITKKH